jgi:hypothetical protein
MGQKITINLFPSHKTFLLVLQHTNTDIRTSPQVPPLAPSSWIPILDLINGNFVALDNINAFLPALHKVESPARPS